ncbi:MAG: hypothetical protein AAGI23_07655 [Bacteroidota bacterium]
MRSRNLFAQSTHWLYQIIRRPLQFSTGLPISVVEWETNSTFDGYQVYDLLGLPAATEGWVSLYYQEEIPDEVVAYFEPFLKDAIVIGFEIPPYFVKICTQLGLPCISMMWDPIRFLDDIFFCFNTNHPEVFAALRPYQLSESLIYQTADLQRARFMRKNNPVDIEGVLVLGQTHIDRSLIKGNRLVSLHDFYPELQALTTKGNLWFKKHPFDLTYNAHQSTLEETGLKLMPHNYNTYDLFCTEQIKHVAAISSGAVLEAHYFDQSAQTFMDTYYQHYQDFSGHTDRYCVSVFSDFLHIDFWATILRPIHPSVRTLSERLPFKPNRMRHANCSYWGYEEPAREQLVLNYTR